MTDTFSSNKNTLLFSLITLFIALGAIELTAWLGLKVLDKQFGISYKPMLMRELSAKHHKALGKFIKDDIDHTGFSAELGWTIKPNSNTGGGTYIANAQQIRASREYSASPPVDKVRIASFGDSYTYGMEVANPETWQEQLITADDNFESLNFGIGGHGLGQAYIRYLSEGVNFSPDIVMIGFMTENINRIVSVYRPYYVHRTGLPLTKPRFKLIDNQLELIPNPYQQLSDYVKLLEDSQSVLPGLGENDFYYHSSYARHPLDFFNLVRLFKMLRYDLFMGKTHDRNGIYRENSEAYQLLIKLFESFHDKAIQNGSYPIIILFPEHIDVENMRVKKPKRYQPLLSWLEMKNYPYLDLMDAIELYDAQDNKDYFFQIRIGHYSPRGNYYVSQQVYEYLVENNLTSREKIAIALQQR